MTNNDYATIATRQHGRPVDCWAFTHNDYAIVFELEDGGMWSDLYYTDDSDLYMRCLEIIEQRSL